MTFVNEFSLQKHEGPYKTWPLKSRLFRNGQPTTLSLPGYSLLHQFLIEDGFLFITDYNCPMEEITEFTWCDSSLRRTSSRSVGWPYESFLLDRLEALD